MYNNFNNKKNIEIVLAFCATNKHVKKIALISYLPRLGKAISKKKFALFKGKFRQ